MYLNMKAEKLWMTNQPSIILLNYSIVLVIMIGVKSILFYISNRVIDPYLDQEAAALCYAGLSKVSMHKKNPDLQMKQLTQSMQSLLNQTNIIKDPKMIQELSIDLIYNIYNLTKFIRVYQDLSGFTRVYHGLLMCFHPHPHQ